VGYDEEDDGGDKVAGEEIKKFDLKKRGCKMKYKYAFEEEDKCGG